MPLSSDIRGDRAKDEPLFFYRGRIPLQRHAATGRRDNDWSLPLGRIANAGYNGLERRPMEA